MIIVTILLAGIISQFVFNKSADYSDYSVYMDKTDNSVIYERDNCFIYYSSINDKAVAHSEFNDCQEQDFINQAMEQKKIGDPILIESTPTPEPTYIPQVKTYVNFKMVNELKYEYNDNQITNYDTTTSVSDCYNDGCSNWNNVTESDIEIWLKSDDANRIIDKVVLMENWEGHLKFEVFSEGTYKGREWVQSELITMTAGNFAQLPVETPKPTPVSTPSPKSTTNTNTNSQDFWNWFESVRQPNWNYVGDSGKITPTASESYRTLSGDCDDFASMVAYYGQEVYGFDTIVILVTVDYKTHTATYTKDVPINHAVAMIKMTDEGIKSMANSCGVSTPALTYKGEDYYPLDWKQCPGWLFEGQLKGMPVYEWSDIVGHKY